MRKKISVFLVCTLLLSLCVSSALAADTTVRAVPEAYLNESVSVVVVGDYKFTTEFTTYTEESDESRSNANSAAKVNFRDNVVFVESLGDLDAAFDASAKRSNGPLAIVISEDVAHSYIEEGADKKELDKLINAGHVAFFPETSYLQTVSIFKALANSSYNAMPVVGSSSDTVTAFVFKNDAGDYLTGNIIPAANGYQENLDARMIKETADNSRLSAVATRTSYDDFSPGSKWNELCEWHKNTFEGDTTQAVWFSEWICFFSAQASDGGHYYAWAGEWCMEPFKVNGVQYLSDYVRYESDANGLQDGVQLRTYWPQNEPSTATGTISLGVNSEDEMEFGVSYNWEIDDLSFTDNSSQINDYCKLRWDYSHTIFGDYDEQISYGKFVMIFKDNNKAGEYTFHHYRSSFTYAQNIWGETASANWRTTYDFEP